MMRIVDLRSDTITLPTDSMRKAMAEAEVGDDVFGEDPTVKKLEAMAADRMGKEAALFTTSGTMANLVCQLVHCSRGDEIILGDMSHVFLYEQGGTAQIGGIHSRTVKNLPDGTLSLEDVEAAIRADNIHFPRTRLVILENTHNRCDGRPLSVDYLWKARQSADQHGLRIHMDGARIFNAAAALQTEAKRLAEPADSVSFCLSKGLSAPVGSLVCGSPEFVEKARRYRKVLGGGMRQSGILAAAGIVALEEMTERLTEDHANAMRLAVGLASIHGIETDPKSFPTNIVYFDLKKIPAESFSQKALEHGVKVLPVGPFRSRAVTHRHISRDDVDYALAVIQDVVNAA